jgi:hypothetical protein
MNSPHYVNALFIMERSKDAKNIEDCTRYVVEELAAYKDYGPILIHLIPMMLEFFTASSSSSQTPSASPS